MYDQQAICVTQISHSQTTTDTELPGDVIDRVYAELCETLRQEDHIEKLAQGRFSLNLQHLRGPNHAKLAAAKFQRLTQSISDGRFTMHSGFALPDEAGPTDAETLQMWADIACREAVTCNSNSVIATDSLIQRHTEYLQLGDDLDQAIVQHALVLFYQPQVDAEGCVSGFESLVRWQRDRLVAPGEFIPQLKKQDLYHLTQFTARQVIRDLATYEYVPALSLNVDPGVLNHDLIQLMLDECNLWEVDSQRLTIEITEAGLVNNYAETVALIARMRDHGMAVAIDDFGTGYSSLAHFKHLPIDELKIDMAFVRNLANDEHDRYLCKMMIDLAHRFGHHVVAEGVEDNWTAEWLFDNGCDLAQGFYFSPPLPKDCLFGEYEVE